MQSQMHSDIFSLLFHLIAPTGCTAQPVHVLHYNFEVTHLRTQQGVKSIFYNTSLPTPMVCVCFLGTGIAMKPIQCRCKDIGGVGVGGFSIAGFNNSESLKTNRVPFKAARGFEDMLCFCFFFQQLFEVRLLLNQCFKL